VIVLMCEIRPHVGAALAAGAADEPIFDIA
jgi:hypothetical protein